MPSRPLTLLRRLLRFSLRTLLLAVLVICVVLGIYVNRVRRQQAAIAAITNLGGNVLYDYEAKNDWRDPDANSWVPAWLRKRLADDYFHSIKLVQMVSQETQHSDSEVEDELFRHLDGLQRLELLNTTRVPVSDEGMSHIGKLRCLRKLEIWDGSSITDAGMAHLAGCRQLEFLHLWKGYGLGDEALDVISQLPRLKTLYLSGIQGTDRGLAHIGQMRQLTTLGLDGCRVTDDGLAHLANLTELESLSLCGAPVTNAGLKHLQGLKNLRSLDLRGTSVTDESQLSAALPGCFIQMKELFSQ